MEIENRIAEVAAAQGLNVQQLAERAGIAYGTALSLWKNHNSRIDLPVLGRICDALNVEPGELLRQKRETKN